MPLSCPIASSCKLIPKIFLTRRFYRFMLVIARGRMPNNNKPITTLALPHEFLPVLLACRREKRDGVVFLGVDLPSVRVLDARAVELFIRPSSRVQFEREYGVVREHTRNSLLYLIGLADGISKRDSVGLYKLIKKWSWYLDPHRDFRALWEEIRRGPINELGTRLNGRLYRTRVVVWWAEPQRKFTPGLYCKDIDTALHAVLLSRLGIPGGLGICLKCQTPFARSRRTQNYCSHRCQVADGMARYRAAKGDKKTRVKKRKRSR